MRFSFGEYQLDTESRCLNRSGQRVHVEPKVFDLLAYLIEHRERVASPDELLDALWPGLHVGPAALTGAVRKAREAVGDDGEHQAVLQTEHGKGFRFVADVSVAPTPGAPAGHSLAVLPFVNMSADPDQEYFADGIAEELLNTLVRFEGLQVVGRTSSFSFKNSDADLKAIGKALDVNMILEGSVRKSGGHLRITAQLLNAEDGFHLWSETYDREHGDIFAIQDEIARSIASALRIELRVPAQQSLNPGGTENVEAYNAYLRGLELRSSRAPASQWVALKWFERAVALDPGFTRAYLEIADVYAQMLARGSVSQEIAEAPARVAIERALMLDPTSSDAYTVRGLLRQMLGELTDYEADFLRAIELNPNNPRAHVEYGYTLLEPLGKPVEAVAYLERAVTLDPLSQYARSLLGEALAQAGRLDKGIDMLRSDIEADPNYRENYWRLANVYGWAAGRFDEAVRWYGQSIAFQPDTFMYADLVAAHLNLGDSAGAEQWLTRLESAFPGSHLGLGSRYLLQRFQGMREAALNTATLLSERAAYVSGYLFMGDTAWLRDLQRVDFEAALAGYSRLSPDLLAAPPSVDTSNYSAAASLALLRRQQGDEAAAAQLLRGSLAVMETMPVVGSGGHGFADVMAHLIAGDPAQAAGHGCARAGSRRRLARLLVAAAHRSGVRATVGAAGVSSDDGRGGGGDGGPARKSARDGAQRRAGGDSPRRSESSLSRGSRCTRHLPCHRQPQRHRQITDCVVAPPRYHRVCGSRSSLRGRSISGRSLPYAAACR